MKRALLLLLTALILGSAALAAPAGSLGMQLDSILSCVPGAQECELGDLAADAARTQTGADCALIPAGLLQNDLPAGPLTDADIARSVGECALVTAILSPAQLFALLESALNSIRIDAENDRYLPEESASDGFLQLSGLSMTVDVTAPAGNRVYKLALPDGTKLGREDAAPLLTVAAPAALLPDGTDGGLTLRAALSAYLTENDVTELASGRIRMIGTADAALTRAFPRWAILAVMAVIAAFCIFFRGKERASRPLRPIREGEFRKPY